MRRLPFDAISRLRHQLDVCGVPRSVPGLFTVDAEPGRRYPVFIVLVRY
jgi:hypothetical protein